MLRQHSSSGHDESSSLVPIAKPLAMWFVAEGVVHATAVRPLRMPQAANGHHHAPSSVGLAPDGVAQLLQGGSLLRVILAYFRANHISMPDGIKLANPVYANTPTARVANWTAVFEALQSGLALRDVTQDDMESWLCGSLPDVVRLSERLRMGFGQVLGKAATFANAVAPPPSVDNRGGGGGKRSPPRRAPSGGRLAPIPNAHSGALSRTPPPGGSSGPSTMHRSVVPIAAQTDPAADLLQVATLLLQQQQFHAQLVQQQQQALQQHRDFLWMQQQQHVGMGMPAGQAGGPLPALSHPFASPAAAMVGYGGRGHSTWPSDGAAPPGGPMLGPPLAGLWPQQQQAPVGPLRDAIAAGGPMRAQRQSAPSTFDDGGTVERWTPVSVQSLIVREFGGTPKAGSVVSSSDTESPPHRGERASRHEVEPLRGESNADNGTSSMLPSISVFVATPSGAIAQQPHRQPMADPTPTRDSHGLIAKKRHVFTDSDEGSTPASRRSRQSDVDPPPRNDPMPLPWDLIKLIILHWWRESVVLPKQYFKRWMRHSLAHASDRARKQQFSIRRKNPTTTASPTGSPKQTMVMTEEERVAALDLPAVRVAAGRKRMNAQTEERLEELIREQRRQRHVCIMAAMKLSIMEVIIIGRRVLRMWRCWAIISRDTKPIWPPPEAVVTPRGDPRHSIPGTLSSRQATGENNKSAVLAWREQQRLNEEAESTKCPACGAVIDTRASTNWCTTCGEFLRERVLIKEEAPFFTESKAPGQPTADSIYDANAVSDPERGMVTAVAATSSSLREERWRVTSQYAALDVKRRFVINAPAVLAALQLVNQCVRHKQSWRLTHVALAQQKFAAIATMAMRFRAIVRVLTWSIRLHHRALWGLHRDIPAYRRGVPPPPPPTTFTLRLLLPDAGGPPAMVGLGEQAHPPSDGTNEGRPAAPIPSDSPAVVDDVPSTHDASRNDADRPTPASDVSFAPPLVKQQGPSATPSAVVADSSWSRPISVAASTRLLSQGARADNGTAPPSRRNSATPASATPETAGRPPSREFVVTLDESQRVERLYQHAYDVWLHDDPLPGDGSWLEQELCDRCAIISVFFLPDERVRHDVKRAMRFEACMGRSCGCAARKPLQRRVARMKERWMRRLRVVGLCFVFLARLTAVPWPVQWKANRR